MQSAWSCFRANSGEAADGACQDRYAALSDLQLVGLIVARDSEVVRLDTQRNNQRLFRTARSILKNCAESEDSVQSAYPHAFVAIRG